MASYVGESLLVKKSAAVLLLLLGIVLIVVGLHEDSGRLPRSELFLCLAAFFFLCLRLSRATKVISSKAALRAR